MHDLPACAASILEKKHVTFLRSQGRNPVGVITMVGVQGKMIASEDYLGPCDNSRSDTTPCNGVNEGLCVRWREFLHNMQ